MIKPQSHNSQIWDHLWSSIDNGQPVRGEGATACHEPVHALEPLHEVRWDEFVHLVQPVDGLAVEAEQDGHYHQERCELAQVCIVPEAPARPTQTVVVVELSQLDAQSNKVFDEAYTRALLILHHDERGRPDSRRTSSELVAQAVPVLIVCTHQSASMLPKPIAFETGLVSLRMGGAPGFFGSRGAMT